MKIQFFPPKSGKMTTRKLNEMRRTLILTAWQDYKLFGCRTDEVRLMARRIVKAKESVRG